MFHSWRRSKGLIAPTSINKVFRKSIAIASFKCSKTDSNQQICNARYAKYPTIREMRGYAFPLKSYHLMQRGNPRSPQRDSSARNHYNDPAPTSTSEERDNDHPVLL